MRKWGAVLVLGAAAAAGQGPWVDLKNGVEAYQKGELVRAEALLRAAAQDERVKDAYFYLGMIQLKKGDVAGGSASLSKVPDDYPTYGYAQRELGMQARSKGDFETACKHLEASATSRPSVEGWLELGRTQTDGKKHEAAEATLKKAEELSKGDLDVQEALSRVYLETGKYAAALGRFETILKAVPVDGSSRFGKAVCLEMLDRKSEAATELEALLAKDPAHAGAMDRLIRLYEDDPAKATERETLKKRLEWVKKNPPKVSKAPPAAKPAR